MNPIIDSIQQRIRGLVRAFGVDIVRYTLDEFSPPDREIYKKIAPYTLTSLERVFVLLDAVAYVVRNRIPGDIVECGVFKGGSSAAIALKLAQLGDTGRNLWMYDTFAGMPEPTASDVSFGGCSAKEVFDKVKVDNNSSSWTRCSLPAVQKLMDSTGYPGGQIRYIEGKVEETIPKAMPDRIALLRLDTDWYESTKHELEHLYPRLSENGVLIIDDYGFWQGARKAVDEYFGAQRFSPLLSRIDHTGRVAVKTRTSQG